MKWGKLIVMLLILIGMGILYLSQNRIIELYHYLISDMMRELIKHLIIEAVEHIHIG